MAAPYFKIDGVDILPYILEDGAKWQRSDLDSDNAGRTQDGIMHRGRVASKIRWDFSAIPLSTESANILLNLILPEYVEVETNIDPLYGYYLKTFYSNNTPATCMTIDPITGEARWVDITFPLVEQ